MSLTDINSSQTTVLRLERCYKFQTHLHGRMAVEYDWLPWAMLAHSVKAALYTRPNM